MGLTQSGSGSPTPTGDGLRKVVAGVENAAASLLVNADVDAAAAIAGTKISSDFGSQPITTTGYISIGASPAASGDVRLRDSASIYAGVRRVLWQNSSSLFFGDSSNTSNIYWSLSGASNYPFFITTSGAHRIGVVLNTHSYDSYAGYKAECVSNKPVTTTTTNATVTTLNSFTLATDTMVVATFVVTAIKDDETQAATYIRTACFRNDSGTVTQVGTTQDGGTFEDDSTWDCTIDVSGTTIRCRVTGKAATSIRWACVSERLELLY